MNGEALTIWTIYYNPRDYPAKWVLRAHDVPGGPHPDCVVVDTLEDARRNVPFGLFRLPRQERDDRALYETWM